jgi:uncharacterized membrane protein YkvA (DUF1232 family)
MSKSADFINSQFKYAEDVAQKPTIVKRIIAMAGKRLRRITGVFVFFTSLKENASDIRRMLASYYEGKYKAIPWSTVVKAVLGMIYFVSFVDIIPDFIPAIGLLDDFVVIAWVVSAIRDDLDKFKNWESQQPTIIHVENQHGNTKGK